MKYKASLHLHTKEDSVDSKFISYSIYELIDEASKKDIKILALTGHKTYIFKEEYRQYAFKKGILLISGIELSIRENFLRCSHVLVLNCGETVQNIRTFGELKEYKLHNPEIFIIAPHPFFDFLNSISKKKLIEFIDIFDAIEHSWFYSKYYNLNERVGILAKRFKKPFISTADVHFLEYLEEDYIVLECEELSEKSVFEAIRDFRYENKTSPKKFFGLVRVFLKMIYLNIKPII